MGVRVEGNAWGMMAGEVDRGQTRQSHEAGEDS